MVHSTDEVERLLGVQVVRRDVLHEWPLSTVELIVDATGRRHIYKVQHEPSVEPEFYAVAQTTLLPSHRILHRDAFQAVMLFEFLNAPRVAEMGLAEADVVALGRSVIESIGEIGGDVPVYLDMGSVDSWRALVALTLADLSTLVEDGRFQRVSGEDVAALASWSESRHVLDAVDATSQLIHADFKADHVFRLNDGYRVVDWQRPSRGPRDIDLVWFLESLSIDPMRYVDQAPYEMRWFQLVHWSVEAKMRLLPELPIFDRWAESAVTRLRVSLSHER